MTMIKEGTSNIPCTFCDKDAVKGTNPPVCELHMSPGQKKQASEETSVGTLKELDAKQ